MAWEEDETCPSRPVVVRTEDDTCVAGYQQTDPAKCAEGHIRDTLVVKIEWSDKEFFMYWNEERVLNYKIRFKNLHSVVANSIRPPVNLVIHTPIILIQLTGQFLLELVQHMKNSKQNWQQLESLLSHSTVTQTNVNFVPR